MNVDWGMERKEQCHSISSAIFLWLYAIRVCDGGLVLSIWRNLESHARLPSGHTWGSYLDYVHWGGRTHPLLGAPFAGWDPGLCKQRKQQQAFISASWHVIYHIYPCHTDTMWLSVSSSFLRLLWLLCPGGLWYGTVSQAKSFSPLRCSSKVTA